MNYSYLLNINQPVYSFQTKQIIIKIENDPVSNKKLLLILNSLGNIKLSTLNIFKLGDSFKIEIKNFKKLWYESNNFQNEGY